MKEIIYKIIEIFEDTGILVKDIYFSFEQGGIWLYITYSKHNKKIKRTHYIAGGVLSTINADTSNLDIELEHELEIVSKEFEKEEQDE